MKNVNVQLIQRLFVLVISLFSLGLSTAFAQIGQLGIYGCPPASYRDNVRYVRLDEYPAVDPSLGYVLPVNGLRNFNFLYTPDGTNFLPGGGYSVIYLNASLSVLGNDIVSYSPNAGHTNGVKVRDFNSPPSTPRGLHGILYGKIGGVNYIFPNARVRAVGELTSVLVQVPTNGNGYYNTYYQNGDAKAFLPVSATYGYHEHYDLLITGYLNGCTFTEYLNELDALWEPYNTVDPSSSTYFVDWAETDIGDLVLDPASCGD